VTKISGKFLGHIYRVSYRQKRGLNLPLKSIYFSGKMTLKFLKNPSVKKNSPLSFPVLRISKSSFKQEL